MLACYALADRLKMRVADVLAMPVTEFTGWLAYCEIAKEDNEQKRQV